MSRKVIGTQKRTVRYECLYQNQNDTQRQDPAQNQVTDTIDHGGQPQSASSAASQAAEHRREAQKQRAQLLMLRFGEGAKVKGDVVGAAGFRSF
jgi:hypothetical protein